MFFLSACIPVEYSVPIEVFFCPSDDCVARFTELAGKDSVCAFYNLNIPEVKSALSSSAVVMHDAKRVGLMHNKFCVFNSTVWTGSWNPVKGSARNNVVVIRSKFIAENFRSEFIELQSGDSSSTPYPEVFLNGYKFYTAFCPEDDCKGKVIDAINSAQNISFMIFSFTDDDIGSLILEKAKKGVVRGIFDSSQVSVWSEYTVLKDFSKVMDGVHHKVFILDNKAVITGSFNPTRNGNERNDENLIIVHDPSVVSEFLEEFDRLWNE